MTNLTKQVKAILDESTISYQFNGGYGQDADKAEAFLNTQRFSYRLIEPMVIDALIDLEDDYELVKDNLAEAIASAIIDNLCSDRLKRFPKWDIGETVTWTLS